MTFTLAIIRCVCFELILFAACLFGDSYIGTFGFSIFGLSNELSKALFDNLTHGFVGYFTWAIIVDLSDCGKDLIECSGCMMLAMVIDIDHFIAARSIKLKSALSLSKRPIFHASSIIPVAVVCIWIISYLRSNDFLKRLSIIFLVAWTSHHIRDGTRRGLWFPPFGSTQPLPKTTYVILIIRTTTVTYSWTPQFQQPQRNNRTKLQYRKPTKSLTRAKTFDFVQKQQNPVRTITRREPVSLSLDDICHLAERERLSYSAKTRREAVELAQNKTHRFEEYAPSRPHTSASRYIHDVRRDAMTPKSIRSEPLPSRANSRMNDIDDDADSVYPINYLASLPVGREICEIIGPQVCSQCKQDQSRQMGLYKCDQCFPTLRISHENMTTAAVLKRYLPDLSESDIQDKIAKGEIAKPRLLKKRIVTKDYQQDLNAKIVSGQLHRAMGFSEKVQEEVLKRQENRRKRSTPTPTKKPEPEPVAEQKERKAIFNPDILLSVSMQVNEPSFFAGRKQEYELPERLPDPLQFADIRERRQLNTNKDFQLCELEEEPEDEEVADIMS
ncbi:Transmembrane protein 267 [Mytilus coruscus]|uniref:Transmembrane protein 267 n=1 Tax=Mytilus coruscus TaxID=42192 RepID=A0A6J8CKC9_MYTCO|nr:Transmembrane protein 267 [Mytilus coruscus]